VGSHLFIQGPKRRQLTSNSHPGGVRACALQCPTIDGGRECAARRDHLHGRDGRREGILWFLSCSLDLWLLSHSSYYLLKPQLLYAALRVGWTQKK